MTISEKRKTVNTFCSGRGCFGCPLHPICCDIQKNETETEKEWENRFYSTLYNELNNHL